MFKDGPGTGRHWEPHFNCLALLAAAGLAAGLSAGRAAAQPASGQPDAPYPEATPRVLIDRSLAQRPVRLVSVSDSKVELIDDAGHTLSLDRSQVLALVPPLTQLDLPVTEERTPPSTITEADRGKPLGRLDLVDGQSLPGNLGKPGAAPKADGIAWDGKLFGSFSVPLDVVSSVLLMPEQSALIPAGVPSEDTVILVNGDHAEGFVSSVGDMITIEKSGKPSLLPASRVVGIALANPLKPAEGAWVWLYDGTAAAVSQLTVDSAGHVTLAARLNAKGAQPAATMDANDLRAVCFDAGSIRPLAASPHSEHESPATWPGTRHWTPPLNIADAHSAPLGAADIEIPGPMVVEWTLPPGAARLGTTAQMPPSARVWGDCELIVESVSGSKTTQLAKARLSGSDPSAEINVDLNGAAKLRMTIDPGPSGPIQDRVVLRRPLVLMNAKSK